MHLPHVEAAHSSQPELRDVDPDDDAQSLNWFSVTANDLGFTPVILTSSSFIIPIPEQNEWRKTSLRPNAHGPPLLNVSIPRAPPV